MIMYYPQFRVLNMTEIATQNFHNLLPMRGALVRDSLVVVEVHRRRAAPLRRIRATS